MPCTLDSQRHSIRLMDIDIEVVDERRLYERIACFASHDKPHKVMYLNAHCAVISRKDKTYLKILNDADLVYADGISVVWAARMLGYYLPCRLTAADFVPRFFRLFVQDGVKIYMLGARPGVAEAAAERLREDNHELQIVGTHHGYFEAQECDGIIETINESNPDVLMVGMGVPYQEKWIEEHFEQIDVPVIWGVGALFDFLSGRLGRGPQWLLDSGFEWLCRLVAEPWRLWRRYLLGNVLFAWYVLRWRAERNKL